MDEYDGRQFVGIDLHRRRSVIVRMTPDGERLGGAVRIDNDPFELARQVASWGESPEVVLEATYGWYWAADVLAEAAWLAPWSPPRLRWWRRTRPESNGPRATASRRPVAVKRLDDFSADLLLHALLQMTFVAIVVK